MLIAALTLTASALDAQAPPPSGDGGRPLAEALRALQDGGLQIFFTSNVVRPEMRVRTEPTATAPREILRQLLAPHGLTTERGPGGRLVVVAAPPSAIRGVVRDRRSARPLAGVRVLLAGTSREASTDAGGHFRFTEVDAGVRVLEAHLPGYVVERIEAIEVAPHTEVEVVFELEAVLLALDEIVVTPSRVTLLSQDPVAAVDLGRDEILALPHLGDDIFRALTLLPGVSGEEVSARFHVRGGRDDEVLVLLDQVELFEPYHLKDFSSSLSIVAPRALSEVNLLTGGFPAQYGDRMSGVLDMRTTSAEDRSFFLGLGILNAELGGSGTFGEKRGQWLGSLRRGALDLTLEFFGRREKPAYWDAFGKVSYQLRPEHGLSFHVLHSDDSLDALISDPDTEETYLTEYSNDYLWGAHQAVLGARMFVDSVASVGRVERDRRGIEVQKDEEDGGAPVGGFEIRDQRVLEVVGFKQDWNFQASDRSYLRWGFDLRHLDSDFDYHNERELEDPLFAVRSEPRTGVTRFQQQLKGEQYSAYLSDRWRPRDPLTVELGVRYDRQTLTDDSDLSPRFNLAWALGEASTLRLAWGLFHQSHRPYELRVEDGETALTPSERTDQSVLGFEHLFSVGRRKTPLLLRLEAYRRDVVDPRVRYENLFEPITEFPEIEPDRVRITAERSYAQGIELLLKGSTGRRLDWWVSYAYARTKDRIQGRDVPRRIDQPHTVSFDLNYRLAHWNLNLAWRYHTGWPTTALSGRLVEDDEGELEVVTVVGPLNAERVPSYHRLDLRASREWQLRRGRLGFFLEIQNVYDRQNIAGFDAEPEYSEVDGELVLDENGDPIYLPVEEIWGGLLPSFGITWEF